MSADDQLPAAERPLGVLAEDANREHAATEAAVADAVRHAVLAGEALLAIQAIVGRGAWHQWLADNFNGSRSIASYYMRFAHYQQLDAVRDGVSISEVRRALRGLPAVGLPSGRAVRWDRRTEASTLRAKGLTYDEIGELMGVTKSSVQYYLNPERRTHNLRAARHRRAAAKKALAQQARDDAVRRTGGAIATHYATLRKLIQAVDRSREAENDRERRAALGTAVARLHGAEDEMVRALGLLSDDRAAR